MAKPITPIRYNDATAANQAFDQQVGAVLAQEQCTDLRQLLARPGGLKKLLENEAIASHLTRPFEAVSFNSQYVPMLAPREKEFYQACVELKLEIPYRTNVMRSPKEIKERDAWYQAHPKVKQGLVTATPWQEFYTARNSPRVKLLRSFETAKESERRAKKADAEVHVLHAISLQEGIEMMGRIAAAHTKDIKPRLYLMHAPYQTGERYLSGHSLLVAALYTPESGAHAAKSWMVEPEPLSDPASIKEYNSVGLGSFTHNPDNLRYHDEVMGNVLGQIEYDLQPKTDIQLVNLALQDPTQHHSGSGSDMNCDLYCQKASQWFAMQAQKNLTALDNMEPTHLQQQLKASMPEYYEEKNGAYQLRNRKDIEAANVQIRWELGQRVLMALVASKGAGLTDVGQEAGIR